MIQSFDARSLARPTPQVLTELAGAVSGQGFLTVSHTGISAAEVGLVLAAYRAFFDQPARIKSRVDMARTGANRGWGGPQSEQVDPTANPDYKEVFDCGVTLPLGDPRGQLSVYAPNRWPELPGFRPVVESYFTRARAVAMVVLRAIAQSLGQQPDYFDAAFAAPMALLRGNYYPPRPDWAGDDDYGIAPHTDYGCLTFLATDGAPGLEVMSPQGAWIPVQVPPGVFVINFGEMLEHWTGGQAKATLHRVRGTADERLSIPMFFNPSYDTNVAPIGSGKVLRAGDHLTRRFAETYVHLQDSPSAA